MPAFRFALATLLAAFPLSAASASLDSLRSFLRDTREARVAFTQTVTVKAGRKGQPSRGELALSRPGKYRCISERVTADGYEVVKTPLPAVFVVSNEVGELRYPTLIERREAKTKPVVSWGMADVDVAGKLERRVVLRRLFAAEARKRECQLIEGTTPAEAARTLARRLRSDGLI